MMKKKSYDNVRIVSSRGVVVFKGTQYKATCLKDHQGCPVQLEKHIGSHGPYVKVFDMNDTYIGMAYPKRPKASAA